MKRQLAIAILDCLLLGAASASDQTLWYRQAASKWTEALPVGNGRLGAMVFGGVAEEHLQLNEDTVWAGEKRDRNNPAGRKALPEVRRLLFAGRPKEAEALAERTMISIPKRLPPYQTLGDMWVRFSGQNDASGYRRELDLDQAVARVTYRSGGARFTREIFSSAPDQVLVMRLTCDQPNRISLTATLTREQDAATHVEGPNRVVMEGEAIARDARHAGERNVGMKFRAVLLVEAQGGATRAGGANVTVNEANAVTLILAARTNFRGVDRAAQCERDLKAGRKTYDELKAAHVAGYRKYFERVKFQLAGSAPDLPADERLNRIKTGASDPQLVTLYFQFGRYLLISSSRPGSLPATLQGIWNDQLAPPWDSKYTININTEMNYWPAETTNLSEMHQPLFDLIEMARENGRQVARELYGARGFVIHHNTDIWGDAVPIDGVGSGLWPIGGAWLSLHLWDHYDFTRDYAFLKNRAYPVMKEAAEFLLDYLV
ncbi:MAG: glycoside hydrolase family 95 protein, partial [Pseudomonadota bacterium]